MRGTKPPYYRPRHGDRGFGPRALSVLVYIASRYPRNTTVRQIAEHLGWCSLAWAHTAVRQLALVGLVRRNKRYGVTTGLAINCTIEFFDPKILEALRGRKRK